MEKIISLPLSVIYYLIFGFFLVLFHPIQSICLHVFGYQAHKKSVDSLNFLLVKCTNLLGTRMIFKNQDTIPKNVPVIFVANHQSMYDILGIIWYLREFHPKFVSKVELGKGIPSVSYNLRHGGSVLINRRDPKSAITEIKKLGEYIQEHNRSAVIFPEGTRSKDGRPKPFAQSGIKILCKYAPSAYLVPITINNSWKLVKFGMFPVGLGKRLEFIIHEAIPVNGKEIENILEKTENAVVKSIKIG